LTQPDSPCRMVRPRQRADVPGPGASSVGLEIAPEAFERWIQRRGSRHVRVTRAHVGMDALGGTGLLTISNASGRSTPGGIHIVWLLRLRGPKLARPVRGTDIIQGRCACLLRAGHGHFPAVIGALPRPWPGGPGQARALYLFPAGMPQSDRTCWQEVDTLPRQRSSLSFA
jgi:hypothetical protein